MAAGEPYAFHEPPRQILRMPGFPAVLAASIRLLGDDQRMARYVLALVGTIACALVYQLGKTIGGHAVGIWSAGLIAVSPVHVGFSPVLLSETVFAATMVLSLLLLMPLFRPTHNGRRALGAAMLAGMGIAVATYVRPSWILIAPIAAACLIFFRGWKSLLPACVVLAATLMTLLPWALRNQQVTGHLVFTTLWAGPSLYDGLHATATGESDMTFLDDERPFDVMSEYEVNGHYGRRALQFAQRNPSRTAELGFIKLTRFWKPWPNATQFENIWIKAAVMCTFVPMIMLAIRGGWLLRHDRIVLLVTFGPILYFSALHTLFVGSLRYRLPTEYPLIVLAAAGILGIRATARCTPGRTNDS